MPKEKNIKLIFAIVVISWSTSWIAAKMQLGIVPEEISSFYRFFIAGLILLSYSLIRKSKLNFTNQEHKIFIIQGACVFSLNHILFYHAMNYISSGVVAALFSLSILISALLNFLFHKTKTSAQILFGGIIGILGLSLIFAGEIKHIGLNFNSLKGLFFCLIGVTLFSFSATITQKQKSDNLIIRTAISMLYGALISLVFAVISTKPILFDFSFKYMASLAYLILIPGIMGFLGILFLISEIGSSKASYTSLFYPVGALIISAIFENYHFGIWGFLGLLMIISGNYIALKSR